MVDRFLFHYFTIFDRFLFELFGDSVCFHAMRCLRISNLHHVSFRVDLTHIVSLLSDREQRWLVLVVH